MGLNPASFCGIFETTHNLVAAFSLKNNDWIHPDNIIQERYIVCAAWQWLGEKEIHSVSVLDNSIMYNNDPTDDAHVCSTLHDVMSQADVLVHHNGDKYDTPYTKTRMLKHGMSPLPPTKSIDTLKVARSQFRFNANNLDYLGKFLGLGEKVHTAKGLWLDIIKGGPKAISAIKQMVKYNKGDIDLLRKVYLKLRPYVKTGPFSLNPDGSCSRCGSTHVHSRGTEIAEALSYQRFQCQKCGGWLRGRKSIKLPRPKLKSI